MPRLEARAKRRRGTVDDVKVEEANAKVQLIYYFEVLERQEGSGEPSNSTVTDMRIAHLIFCCAVQNAIVALSGARVVSPRESEVGKVERAEVGMAVAGEGTIASIDCFAAA